MISGSDMQSSQGSASMSLEQNGCNDSLKEDIKANTGNTSTEQMNTAFLRNAETEVTDAIQIKNADAENKETEIKDETVTELSEADVTGGVSLVDTGTETSMEQIKPEEGITVGGTEVQTSRMADKEETEQKEGESESSIVTGNTFEETEKVNTFQGEETTTSQPTVNQPTANKLLPEAQTVTATGAPGSQSVGYLQHVITCLQSASGNHSYGQKDHVMISRGDLDLLVKQTLRVQTVFNHTWSLMQQNKQLQREKQALVEYAKVLEAQRWQLKNTDRQVFCFEKCSLPQPRLFCSAHRGQEDDSKSSITSLVTEDGESMSIQLASELGLDGDHACDVLSMAGGKEASGNIPHVVSSNQGATETGASPPAPFRPNIPACDLMEAAHCYSVGPQLPPRETVSGSLVSQEQYDQAIAELEKMKRYVYKLLKDGGLCPNTADELVYLRNRVSKLQDENLRLAQNLQDRPVSAANMKEQSRLGVTPDQKNQVEKLKHMVQLKDDIIDALNEKVKQLQKELSKNGMQSQPPSTVGLTALPPIPTVAQTSCQTEASCHSLSSATQTDIAQETVQLLNLQRQLERVSFEYTDLEKEFTKIQEQVIQARDNEREHYIVVEKVQAQNRHLQQQLTEANKHRMELAEQLTGLNNEMDSLKRKAMESDKRWRALEKMINDERRRYSRDEEELLKRIDTVGREKSEMWQKSEAVVKLLLAADAAWSDGTQYGTAVPRDYTAQVTSLRQHRGSSSFDSPAPLVTPSIVGRSSGSRATPSASARGSPDQGLIGQKHSQRSAHRQRNGGMNLSAGATQPGDSTTQRQSMVPHSLPSMSTQSPQKNRPSSTQTPHN